MTFFPEMAKATARLRETNDFPSPDKVEVNIRTRASFAMKFRSTRSIRKASEIRSFLLSLTTIASSPSESLRAGISPTIGMVVYSSISLRPRTDVFNSRMMTCTPNGISSPTIKAAASMEERAGDTGE